MAAVGKILQREEAVTVAPELGIAPLSRAIGYLEALEARSCGKVL